MNYKDEFGDALIFIGSIYIPKKCNNISTFFLQNETVDLSWQ